MSSVVGICAFFRDDQFASGAYSFAENLHRGMATLRRTLPPNEQFEAVVFQGNRGLRWSDDQLQYRTIADPWGRWPAEARAGLIESKGFAGILFPNTFTPPFVSARRAVTVIHDLHYIHLPEHWPLAKRMWMRSCHEFSLRKCDAVVAISQAVKDDILTHYGSRWESRVHAIWNPISLERFESSEEQTITGGRPYILCAAADRPSKNLSTLIRAFAKFHERHPEYCLVLAGQLRSDYRVGQKSDKSVDSKMPAAAELVVDLNLSNDVLVTGYIPDAALGSLYRGAALFVLPSLFEGFGMPAAEAIALGCPVLVTDMPVLREVTLNRANYIEDPLDDGKIADQIEQILALGAAARPQPEFSSEIRRLFAPETIARRYLKLLTGE